MADKQSNRIRADRATCLHLRRGLRLAKAATGPVSVALEMISLQPDASQEAVRLATMARRITDDLSDLCEEINDLFEEQEDGNAP
jgi:hypothetical protein